MTFTRCLFRGAGRLVSRELHQAALSAKCIASAEATHKAEAGLATFCCEISESHLTLSWQAYVKLKFAGLPDVATKAGKDELLDVPYTRYKMFSP